MSTVYQGHQSSSRMFVGLMVVVAFHLIAIVAFKTGLLQHVDPIVVKPPITVFDVPMDEPPPPPPAPVVDLRQEMQQPVIDYIAPDIPIEAPPIESPVTVAETGPVARETSTAPSGEGPQIVDFQVDSRYPLTRPYYPPPDIRLGHEGLVTLMIYVMPNGRVGEAKIATTSGFRGLDDSAIREAIKSWRFKPRMEGGRAVASWGTFRVRFKLD